MSNQLKNLLEKSEQLIPHDLTKTSQDSQTSTQIHKGLDSLFEESKKFFLETKPKTDSISISQRAKGDQLLAGKNFDVEKYRDSLLNISEQFTDFEPTETLSSTDIEAWLKNEYDYILTSAIEEANIHTSALFYHDYESELDYEWSQSKTELMKNLERNKNNETKKLGNFNYYSKTNNYKNFMNYKTSFIGNRGNFSQMTFKQAAYSKVVHDLNMSLKKDDDFYPLIQEFVQSTIKMEDISEARKLDIIECWNIISIMLNEKEMIEKKVKKNYSISVPLSSTLPTSVTEDSIPSKTKSRQNIFISRAKSYLSSQYRKYIFDFVTKRIKKSNISIEKKKNLIANCHKVSKELIFQYIDFKMKKQPSDFKAWASIYYSIRCGLINDAISFANDNNNIPDTIRTFLYHFGNNSLTPGSEKKIYEEYKQIIHKNNNDEDIQNKINPFQEVIYFILGKIKIEKRFKPIDKIEDYVWLKLNLINNEDDSIDNESGSVEENKNYSLEDLQKTIKDNLQNIKKTQKKDSVLYFRLLLLTQQFEEAIEYLCGLDTEGGFPVDAVHFAIVLYYYKVLNLPPNIEKAPLFSHTNKPCLNFHFLIHDYVSNENYGFAHTNPLDALNYLYLLIQPSLIQHEDRDKLGLKYIKELVIKSKETNGMLGSINKNGERKKGFLERLLNEKQMLDVIRLATNEYETNGKINEVVDLYFIAEEIQRNLVDRQQGIQSSSQMNNIDSFEFLSDENPQIFLRKIVELLNKELGNVVITGNNRKEIIYLSEKVNNKLMKMKYEHKSYDTFKKLLGLSSFFTLFHHSEYIKALKLIEQMNILPFSFDDKDGMDLDDEDEYDDSFIMSDKYQFDEQIKKKLPDIVYSIMKMLNTEYKKIKTQNGFDQSLDLYKLSKFKQTADSIMTFSGKFMNNMSANISNQITKMYTEMS